MKRIPLSQGRFALVDDEDYDWLMTWRWYANKDYNTFYATASRSECEGGNLIYMHRLLLCHPMGLVIDHLDHDGLNNQRSNLRAVTHRENLSNLRTKGTSEYVGVSWSNAKSKWVSQIRIQGRKTFLGYFDIEADAASAYTNALKRCC
jgi:hypothetical protein